MIYYGMTYGYPIELRARALSFLDSGEKQQKVCEVFAISRRTLYSWIKLREETGDIQIKERPKVRSTRKLTKDALLAYVDKHSDHFLREIAQSFGVAQSSVFAALRKFGITRKKNDALLRARREQKARIRSRNREAEF